MNKLTILTTVAAIAFSSSVFAQTITAQNQDVNVSGVNNKVSLTQIGTKTSRTAINIGDKKSQMGKDNVIDVTQKNGENNQVDLKLTGGDDNNLTVLQDGSRNRVNAILGKDKNNFGVSQVGDDNTVDIDGQATMNNGRFNGQVNQTGNANKFKFTTYATDKDTNLNSTQMGNDNSVDVLNHTGVVKGTYVQKGNKNKISVDNKGTAAFDATQNGNGNDIEVVNRNKADTTGKIIQDGSDNEVIVHNFNSEKGVLLDVSQKASDNSARIADLTSAGGNDFNKATITQEGNSSADVTFNSKGNRGGNNTATIFQAANSIPVNVSIAGRSNNVTVTQK